MRYAVRVTDREDGSLESGRIAARRVVVTAEYLKDGPPAAERRGPSRGAGGARGGQALIEAGTCLSCHQLDREVHRTRVHGSRAEVSATTAPRLARLVRKIRDGGSGVWGTGDDAGAPAAHRSAGVADGRLHPEPRRRRRAGRRCRRAASTRRPRPRRNPARRQGRGRAPRASTPTRGRTGCPARRPTTPSCCARR